MRKKVKKMNQVLKKEVRYTTGSELRVVEDTEKPETKTIRGYVLKFNERSLLLFDEWYEKVCKGAFSRSLETNTIKALWNHNTDVVLGSTKSRTLSLKEDDVGLFFEVDLPNTTMGKDLYESIKRGDVDGVSFGFYVRENGDRWEYLKDEDVYERTLLDIDLVEISPTAFPAYPSSEAGARSLESRNLKTKEERLEALKLKEKLEARIKLLKI